MRVEDPAPIPWARREDSDLAAGGEDQARQRLVVQWIASGAGQELARVAERKQALPPEELDAEPQALEINLGAGLVWLPQLAADKFAIGSGQGVVGQGPELVQHLLDWLAGAHRDDFRAGDRRLVHKALVLQELQHSGALRSRHGGR